MRSFRFLMILCIVGLPGNVRALPVTDGLVLHLDAGSITDVSDGAKIDTWTDLSSYGNDATQSNEDLQPVFIARSSSFKGYTVVRFDGENDWMTLPPTTVTVGSFTVFAVARFNYTDNNQYIMNAQDGSGDDRIRFEWDNTQAEPFFEFRAGSSGWMDVTAPADTKPHIFGMTSTVEGFLDGVSLGTAANTSNEIPTAFNLGSYNRGEKDHLNGEIAEFIVYNRVLSPEEIALVFSYLAIKTDFAYDPNPADKASDVSNDVILSWMPGDTADKHNVYFGTDVNDVNEAGIDDQRDVLLVQNHDANTYDPGILDFMQTYYWRVDEVNDLELDSPWKGNVWSFRTGNYKVVEDFEDYNDYSPNEIWSTWIDGFGVATNGSTAGYPDPDFNTGEHYMEMSIVHSGAQSMPIFYDNSAGISEVTKTLTSMRNWTQDDVVTLTLWYYGDAANAIVPMYVALNGNAVVTNPNTNAVSVTEWTPLDIPLQDFASKGVNLTNVSSISVGFGNKAAPQVGGGSGHVFIDDVRLYR